MFKILFLLLLSTCVRNYVFGQSCFDCIVYSDCPAAMKLLTMEADVVRYELLKAGCGFDGNTPKVCCSMLSSPTPASDGDVDHHANLRLLPDTCGFKPGDRIIGGTVAGLYDYPWMVLISYKTSRGPKFQCGGTLINDRYVLTAAHCIVGDILGVRIGENDIRTDTDCQGKSPNTICESKIQDMRVEKKIVHEQYTRSPIKNDIALLRLQRRVDFKPKNAGAICLPVSPSMREPYIERGNGTVAGWGYTEKGYTSPVLLFVGVPIYSKSQCSEVYNRGVTSGYDDTENKICAGANGKDSCGGDSGGPLMVDGIHLDKPRLIQRGIVSYGPQACASDNPGVYTDVAAYMKWILDNMEE